MSDDARMRARYRRITRFAARVLAQTWWFELVLPRFGLSGVAERTRPRRMTRTARRFHALAVDLGGLMIKVGQFLSTRLDVLPPEITKELEGLQDEVPPVAFPAIRALAESELGVPLTRAFARFDEVPVAAASLGQAHRAVLAPDDAAQTGYDAVVVKIQRPGIDDIVAVDLEALRKIGVWLSRVRLVADRVDAPALVEEFARTSLEEIDYLHEAAGAERFATSFADDPRVRVPDVVWERATRRVLTMQDVTAIKINDIEGLRAAGIDPSEVASDFAAVMFDQLFVHGYFHADPHPGNIFVTPLDDDVSGRAWAFTFIDFGMMGEVSEALRRGLRRIFIAAASRDGKGMVAGIREIGVLLPSAETTELERAMTALFARFGGMGFAELQEVDPREFQAFAIEFGDIVRSLPFQLPENFLLIIRAMSLTSGMCSTLDASFNIWDAVEPYAGTLLRAEGGNVLRTVVRDAADTAGVIARLPRRLDDTLTRVEDGRLAVQSPRLERRVERIERMLRRVLSAVLFAGLLTAGAVLHQGDAVWGVVLMTASVIPLAHALFSDLIRPGGRR
jgi:predicted unusual protein kinase regulating ubiquinone biosynthesis (AarF/ABC1/UbiB family)